MKNSICIIGVYFGAFPHYFDLWKKSVEYNQSIDFLVITNQQINNLPHNMRVVNMELEEMEKLATTKLAIPNVTIKRPYKCCDFKPVYGVIFQEYISDYLYWGHCDFDMIFGDLSYFFEKYNLYSYDKFLTLGHLTLYKNTKENNMRYMCDGGRVDYKTVFTTNNNYAFDELTGVTQIYISNGFKQFTERIFSDIASVYSRYRDIEKYPLDQKAKNYRYQVYYWKDGHVYRKWFDRTGAHEDEYIYIHFKKRPNYVLTFDINKSDGFYITNTGFYSLYDEPDVNAVKSYNKYHPFIELMETLKYKFKPYFPKNKKMR